MEFRGSKVCAKQESNNIKTHRNLPCRSVPGGAPANTYRPELSRCSQSAAQPVQQERPSCIEFSSPLSSLQWWSGLVVGKTCAAFMLGATKSIEGVGRAICHRCSLALMFLVTRFPWFHTARFERPGNRSPLNK